MGVSNCIEHSDIKPLMVLQSPYIHTNGQWAARSVIAGFFTAPIEALPEVTVTDVVSLSQAASEETSDKCLFSILPMNAEHTSASTPVSWLEATSSHPSSAASLPSITAGNGCSTGPVFLLRLLLCSCFSSWKRQITRVSM